MSTLQQKLFISIKSALLFALVNLPHTYNFMSSGSGLNIYDNETKCPTNLGLLISAILFFVLTFLSMWYAPHSLGLKLKFSIYGTLIFYLISSPAVFSFVSSVMGDWVANKQGCPSIYGVLLHALVYCFALVGVMYLPPELE
jgi:hypothetical protein